MVTIRMVVVTTVRVTAVVTMVMMAAAMGFQTRLSLTGGRVSRQNMQAGIAGGLEINLFLLFTFFQKNAPRILPVA